MASILKVLLLIWDGGSQQAWDRGGAFLVKPPALINAYNNALSTAGRWQVKSIDLWIHEPKWQLRGNFTRQWNAPCKDDFMLQLSPYVQTFCCQKEGSLRSSTRKTLGNLH
eukprot:3634966-Amphidinium_carterae.2